jgi:vitamin K-dependent gamma-carboxylase
MIGHKWQWQQWFAPVDGASIAVLRIALGLILLWDVLHYFQTDWIATYWIKPRYHFGYWPLEFLRPLPGAGMYLLFAVLGFLALCIALGCLYRMSIALFWLGFTYTTLLEQTRYLNHFYLVSLLCFVLIFVPAHRQWSLDSLLFPRIRAATVPAWSLWWLRFTIALPYCFGGIAKLNPDWLQGEPMQMWMADKTEVMLIGPCLANAHFALAMAWSGMLLDLLVVPALLWRRTRWLALGLVTMFHVLNAQLFDIGIFPWLMLCATTIFLPPNWPLNLWQRLQRHPAKPTQTTITAIPKLEWRHRLLVAIMIAFLVVQIFLPLRHFFIPGNVHWTEEGHRYAWHMKLRSKSGYGFFTLRERDGAVGNTVSPSQYLEDWQVENMLGKPTLIWQFAQILKQEADAQGRKVQVYADIHLSLNGRADQRFIDPNVDLAAAPRPLWPPTAWILPLTTPLHPPAH